VSELPEPRANPLLLGQVAAEATLLDALRGGRLHHGWLLLGPEGVGKATLAYHFARRLLAGPADTLFVAPDDPVFRRVASGGHADLLTVERSYDAKRKKLRGEIVVDDVARIATFLRLTPAEGGWRVVVLDGAEDLNRNAANALLKVLEEPPPRAVLLLVCAAAGRLPQTVRSRCRRLRLGPLPDADVSTLLAQARADLPEAARRDLVALSGGSIGRALDLAAEDGAGLGEAAERLLRDPTSLGDADAERAHAMVARQEDGFGTFVDLLRARLADGVRAAARGETIWHGRPLDRWVAVWHAIGALRDETEGLNLDKRQAMSRMLRLLSGGLAPEDAATP